VVPSPIPVMELSIVALYRTYRKQNEREREVLQIIRSICTGVSAVKSAECIGLCVKDVCYYMWIF